MRVLKGGARETLLGGAGHVHTEDRRFAVLQAIVADYVATQEPVGSKSLVERHQLPVSSATIRNDMAVLEQEGYIVQPHTSAGRIPTDKGYRLFVDRLSQVKPLATGERRAIEAFLSKSIDLEDVLRRSVRLLAQLTQQVAVVQYPTLSRAVIRHIEVVAMSSDRLLLVIITDAGRVEQQLVETTTPIGDDTIVVLRTLLARHIAGKEMSAASHALDDVIAAAPTEHVNTAFAVVGVLREALVDHPEERLLLAGTGNITGAWADQPATLRGVLEALDEQVTLLKLLAALDRPDALNVSIGAENVDENLHSSALISAGYGAGEVLFGGVGVVGPMRMDYPGTMATVRAVARYVGEIVSGT